AWPLLPARAGAGGQGLGDPRGPARAGPDLPGRAGAPARGGPRPGARDRVQTTVCDAGVHGIYLVPFHRAEVSLAAGLLRLRSAPEQADRLPMFRSVDWSAAFARLGGTTRTRGA